MTLALAPQTKQTRDRLTFLSIAMGVAGVLLIPFIIAIVEVGIPPSESRSIISAGIVLLVANCMLLYFFLKTLKKLKKFECHYLSSDDRAQTFVVRAVDRREAELLAEDLVGTMFMVNLAKSKKFNIVLC